MTEEKINVSSINIPLYYDSLFKAVMTRHPDILFALIRDILEYLDIKIDGIKDVMAGYELLPTKKDRKIYRSDILVKILKLFCVCVEVNCKDQKHLDKRNHIIASGVYGIIAHSGISYKELSKLKILLVNINLGQNISGQAIEVGCLKEDVTNIKLTEMPIVVNLSIAKCRELYYNIGKYKSKDDKLIRWMVSFQERNFDKIFDIMGKEILTMEQQKRLVQQLKDYNDEESVLDDDFIEMMYNLKVMDIEGTEREKEQERQERLKKLTWENGHEEGIKEGIINTIINMLKKKLDYNLISDITGKDISEIKMIEKQMC